MSALSIQQIKSHGYCILFLKKDYFLCNIELWNLADLNGQNAPDSISKYLIFQNFPPSDSPTISHLQCSNGAEHPHTSPPDSLESTPFKNEKEDPRAHG